MKRGGEGWGEGAFPKSGNENLCGIRPVLGTYECRLIAHGQYLLIVLRLSLSMRGEKRRVRETAGRGRSGRGCGIETIRVILTPQ